MQAKLTRTLFLLALLLYTAVGAAQAEMPAEECPSFNASELRRDVGNGAQALQAEARKISPRLSELEPPRMNMPELPKIQPDKAMQSLGERAKRVKQFEWREGASALASGAASSVTRGWQDVKEVAPASARCLQQWTGRASNVVQNVPAPDLTKPMQESLDSSGAPERLEPALPLGLETGTGMLDSVRRAVVNRVIPQDALQFGSGVMDTLANAFPTAFRLIKYYVIWVFSTSILITVLLLVLLARVTYLSLFSPGRAKERESLK